MKYKNLDDVQQDISGIFDYIKKYLDDKTILTAELKLKVWNSSSITLTKQFKIIPDTVKEELKRQNYLRG